MVQRVKKTTEERLTAAHLRAEARAKNKIKKPRHAFEERARNATLDFDASKTKTAFGTAFGSTNLSSFPTKDPGAKVTTVAKDYGKATVGHKYTELSEALTEGGAKEADVADDLLEGSTTGTVPKVRAVSSFRKKNAAAKMLAIANVSEQKRFGGSAKAFRAVLRMVKAGKVTFKEAFTGDAPLFPMAKNPTYMRRLVNVDKKRLRKPPPKPKKWDELAEHMSDDSDND